ncbi:MAG TPA: hypothetical protein VGO45_05280 [Bacteroidia bacterium]|nr:hypothetical protein [Bacteroidia bacterium]
MNQITAIAATLLLMSARCLAQDSQQMMKQIEHDDQTTVDAIALYPAETRHDILEAAKYPEVIVRLNAMQKQSQAQFTDMLAPYDRNEQEKIWNLTRYPALISDIAYDHRKSEGELNDIVSRYPEEIRRTAMEEGLRNYDLIVQLDRSNAVYQSNLDRLLMAYPHVAANAYRNLIKQPDILSTLYDNMQMTVILGDIYNTDPQYVLYETDSLNQALTQQNAQAAADWQQSIQDNPEAQQEYTQAAEQYAQENGYTSDEYAAPMTSVVVTYNTYPYNWWYGYPTWYVTPCWDPYPFWYDWGFYYGPGRRPVFFGMPSYHFMNWYFYDPEHCRRYPTFGSHCYGFYSGHRDVRYSNSVSRGVNEWRRRNKDVVTKDWDKEDLHGRAQRFKEYGQLETDRAKYNRSNPQQPLERKDFLARNQNRYPHTVAVAVNNTPRTNGQPYEAPGRPGPVPVTRPHVKIPESFYQNNPSASPSNGVRNEPPVRNEPVRNNPPPVRDNPPPRPVTHEYTPPARDNGNDYHPAAPARPISNETRSARDYHQSTWQEVQPQQHFQAPPPRQESAPRPSPAPSPSRGGGRPR